MDKGALLILGFIFIISCNTSKATLETPPAAQFLLQKDRLDNFYLTTSNGGLYKLSSDGDTLGYYLNRRWGKPQGIDVFNPQKILLHYRSYNKVVILDQSLSSELVTDLESWSWDVQTVGQSSDQYLWVYDQTDRRIKKMTLGGEVILESDPIYFLLQQDFVPDQIMERKGVVWVGDQKRGWLRLDLFGQYIDFLSQTHQWFTVTQPGLLLYWSGQDLVEWAPGKSIPQILDTEIMGMDHLLRYWKSKTAKR